MFADHRIGCERQAEFLKSDSTCLLRQISDTGLREKTIEDHLLKARSIKCRRDGIVKLSRFGRDEVQRARLHATAVALRHCAAASDRKIRSVERETRCR